MTGSAVAPATVTCWTGSSVSSESETTKPPLTWMPAFVRSRSAAPSAALGSSSSGPLRPRLHPRRRCRPPARDPQGRRPWVKVLVFRDLEFRGDLLDNLGVLLLAAARLLGGGLLRRLLLGTPRQPASSVSWEQPSSWESSSRRTSWRRASSPRCPRLPQPSQSTRPSWCASSSSRGLSPPGRPQSSRSPLPKRAMHSHGSLSLMGMQNSADCKSAYHHQFSALLDSFPDGRCDASLPKARAYPRPSVTVTT